VIAVAVIAIIVAAAATEEAAQDAVKKATVYLGHFCCIQFLEFHNDCILMIDKIAPYMSSRGAFPVSRCVSRESFDCRDRLKSAPVAALPHQVYNRKHRLPHCVRQIIVEKQSGQQRLLPALSEPGGLVILALEDGAQAEAEVGAFGFPVLIGVRDIDVALKHALDHAVVAQQAQQRTTICMLQFGLIQFAEIHN
jgi:hypothetical protein